MEIRRNSKDLWNAAYDIWCRTVVASGENGIRNTFALTQCSIEPLGQSMHHHHDDQEIFFITHGNGHMTIGSETTVVFENDAIFIPPHTIHSLKNSSTTDTLIFFSLAWLAPLAEMNKSPTLIIPAPPTPNGELHLGHLSGPYLAADVFHRYQKLRGIPSAFFLGTDDHQCYITNKARALGITNDDVLKLFRPAIHEGLRSFSVAPDLALLPKDDEEYCQFIRHFFSTLIKNGALVLRHSPTVYCNDAKKFIFGADVHGECPHCHHKTVGHGCEQCGHYNDGHDLISLRSSFGSKPVSIIETDRYYFPLDHHREFLRQSLAACSMHPRLREFYDDYLKRELPDVSASHFSDWGINVPALADQTIYEWIEMAGGYVYLLNKAQAQLNASARTIDLVEAFGFDNSFFYGLLVPALINAYDPLLPKPKAFLTNYFYLLDNEKFSTSRNHAIWARDFLHQLSPDGVRLYLSLTRAENQPTNFSLAKFADFMHTTVHDCWQNFFTVLCEDLRVCDSQWVPIEFLQGYQERFVTDCKTYLWHIDEALSTTFSLNRAASQLIALLDNISNFHARHRYTHVDRLTNLSLILSALEVWAHALSPIAPQFARACLRLYGETKPSTNFTFNTQHKAVAFVDMEVFTKSKREIENLDVAL